MKLLDNVLSLEIRKRNIHCELLTKYIKKLEMLEGRFKAYIQSVVHLSNKKHFRLVSKVMEYCSEFLAMSEKAIKSKSQLFIHLEAIDALKKEKQGKGAVFVN
ncbi:hypothetical protein RF11_10228 [Thelohanellus kitauei]|uniref:Uncharacterized protein n=1 Tax=Thelohanellus kitauei TaxID=669202 RepID=A0A0C2J5F1_THEKT|nr:hypothetical protein RF11_10228 [Thelohanellus kitauei]